MFLSYRSFSLLNARLKFHCSCYRSCAPCSKDFHIGLDVAEALKNKKPVLALESTIITHGMPYPENLRTAQEVEEIVRSSGVVPATVGVIKGQIHVGMNNNLLEALARDKDARKLSRRDLAFSCSNELSGGTTVSSTMLIAHRCGIKVFVTGGIGGVHRCGQDTMDVSADLRELGRTPLTVISAGIKSILDVGRTLEYLETEGVTVASVGEEVDFPGFFTKSCGIPSPNNVATVDDAASLMAAHNNLGVSSGILLAVPIPDKYSHLGNIVENVVQSALEETRELNISGSEVTPYVLKRVNELTDGLSLKANILLIKNNAQVGANIAKRFYELAYPNEQRNEKRPTVIGGCNMDVISKCSTDILSVGPSNPAKVTMSLGGVGKNIAEVLWRLNNRPSFLSAVGSDYNGDIFTKELSAMDIKSVEVLSNYSTGIYNVIMDRYGEVFVATQNTDIDECINAEMMSKYADDIINSSIVCIDANISEDAMKYICSQCYRHSIPILYEPTCVLKAAKAYRASNEFKNAITYTTPNLEELLAIYSAVTGNEAPNISQKHGITPKFARTIMEVCEPLLDITPYIIITLGENGVLCSNNKNPLERFTHYPLSAQPRWSWLEEPVANASGAGDSFAAGFVHGILRHPGNFDLAVRIGLTVAQRTLRSHLSVSPFISVSDETLQDDDWTGQELLRHV